MLQFIEIRVERYSLTRLDQTDDWNYQVAFHLSEKPPIKWCQLFEISANLADFELEITFRKDRLLVKAFNPGLKVVVERVTALIAETNDNYKDWILPPRKYETDNADARASVAASRRAENLIKWLRKGIE